MNRIAFLCLAATLSRVAVGEPTTRVTLTVEAAQTGGIGVQV